MDTDHLQTFLTVARLRSFTRAAAELHLSQPAVSRRIQVLEEQLGERLFERLGRSIHPTAAGLTLVEQARGVLGSLDRLTEAVRAHADPEQATLRLGASTTPGLYLLPRVVEELGRDHPGLRCTFVIDNSAAILQRVLANELDLGMVGGPVTATGLQASPVVNDRLVCFARPDHRLATCSAVTVAQLRAETWILRDRGSATRGRFDRWLAELGGPFERVIELRDPEAAKLLVDAGLGLSCGSRMGLAEDLERERFVELSVAAFHLERTLSVVHHVDKFITTPMATVIARVRESVAHSGA